MKKTIEIVLLCLLLVILIAIFFFPSVMHWAGIYEMQRQSIVLGPMNATPLPDLSEPTTSPPPFFERSRKSITGKIIENATLYNHEGRKIDTLVKGTQIEIYFIMEKSISGVKTRVVPYYDERYSDEFLKSPKDKGVGFVKLSALELPQNTTLPVVEYGIDKQGAYRIVNGKRDWISEVEVEIMKQSGWQCFMLHDFSGYTVPYYGYEKTGDFYDWEHPGLFFFDASGKFLMFIPCDSIEASFGFFFSPNEKYLAQDVGTQTVRTLYIWSFPEFKRVGIVRCAGAAWSPDSGTLFYTALTEKNRSTILLGDSVFHDIAAFNLADGKNTIIQTHDALSDYYLESVSNENLSVKKVSVVKADDWGNRELWKEEQIKIPNPFAVKKP
jgi:hypothetical protein